MKTYIINFFKKDNNGNDILIIKAAGVGNDVGESVVSAQNAVKLEYPEVISTSICSWTAEPHHMKLAPGKLE